MNRFLAVVAVFGAFGTVALALALTPEAQTSASYARAVQDAVATSEPEPAAPPAAAMTVAATPPTQESTFESAALAQRTKKSDRLARSFRTPPPEPRTARQTLPQAPAQAPLQAALQSGGVDRRPEPEVVPGPVAYEAAERDVAVSPRATVSSGRTAPGPKSRLAPEPSRVPVPGETSPDASADDIDEITEIAVGNLTDSASGGTAEEAAEEATEQAAVATRPAAVTTDVNMRARPANGAAVVVVVPRRSVVEVIGCDYWCEVMYAGKRGFIYKSFVRGAS